MYICIGQISERTPLMHCLQSIKTKQMRFQVMLKQLWPHSWMTQIVSQWIQNCGTSSSQGTSAKGAATSVWMQMTATGDIGDGNIEIGKVCRSNNERSLPACTGPAGVRPASAGRREAAVPVHVHTCRCWFVCLFVCLGFNGTFSTNRLYRAVTVG